MELIQGNIAAVRASINAGCNFFAGYPITPSSDIAHKIAELMPGYGGVFIQMEDEISSICAAIGASMTGATVMTATSGPGFSLMQESIGYAAMTETPVVIINVMRAGPSTGIPTLPSQGDVMQAINGGHGDYPIVVLTPANVEDMYCLTKQAFLFAEKYSTPVIVLADEIMGHMRESVDIPKLKRPEEAGAASKKLYQNTNRAILGIGRSLYKTGLAHNSKGAPTIDLVEYESLLRNLFDKIKSANELIPVKQEGDREPEILFVVYGSPYRSARAALRALQKQGIRAGLIKLEIINPFPEKAIKAAASSKAKRIIVPEMNMGQAVKIVKQATRGSCAVKGVSSFGDLMSPEALIEAAIK
jgi:2-oxoglutarate ferredoxin oxidoreductase subunit alpha